MPALRELVLWPENNVLDISQQDALETLVLIYRSGAPINVLADALRIDPSTMSRIIDRLTLRGLAIKVRSEKDSRIMVVRVTADGLKEFSNSFWPALDRHRTILEQTFTPRQLTALASSLVRLVQAFDEAIDSAAQDIEGEQDGLAGV